MMGMITTLEYAEMANRVYQIDNQSNPDGFNQPGYKCDHFKDGMRWGATVTDFKGCVYVRKNTQDLVVAFQGTKLTKAGDILSDVQIVIGMLPQYCSAALRLFERADGAYPGYRISLVGHSLGGAIAQVIGHWTGAPFVTFNAPGVWGDIQRSKILLWAPQNRVRSLRGARIGSPLAKQMAATGRNFRNVLDLVSSYGMHYGPVTRFWGLKFHSMDDFVQQIRASRWADLDPLDPRNKEWGEL
jgi:hypothetical protein